MVVRQREGLKEGAEGVMMRSAVEGVFGIDQPKHAVPSNVATTFPAASATSWLSVPLAV